MQVSPATLAFATIALAILLASVWTWLSIIVRKSCSPRAQPLVPWNPRRPVPWAFIDLLLLIALWILAAMAADLATSERQAMLLGNVLVSLCILAIGLPLIGHRTRARPRDFGISISNLLSDLRLGFLGFVLLAPPVYALQGLLVRFWKPSQHPLVELFKGEPDSLLFVLLFLSAAIVAPLFEEFIFRVVLQGYLEKWFAPHMTLRELILGNDRQPQMIADQLDYDASLENDVIVPATPADDANPYAPPQVPQDIVDPQMASSSENQPELRGIQAWYPIAISSAVFALLHYTHGPDWIPLLFLAAGMGYLYQRTHRLLPSLTVHCLLNSYSLWGLWLQVQGKGFSS